VVSGPSVIWTDIGGFAVLCAQLLLLLIAALVAWGQVREARRLREQQIRPIVVLDFETQDALFFLKLTNFGNAMARNVKISVTPPLESALDDQTERVAGLQMFGQEGIPTLAPGKEIRTLFDVAFQRKPETGLPDVYVARITYDDQALERHFDEEVTLDLGVYWGLQRVELADVDDVHKRLKELVDVVTGWSASGGGLLRVSPAEVDERNAAWRAQVEERRHQRSGESGTPDETS
jgi:hypothetical protein